MNRVYKNNIKIDQLSIKDFYKKRAFEKKSIDIDAPVVLCGDKDKRKIKQWTSFETENRLPLLKLNSDSVVLELGCGTGRISKFITPYVKEYVGIDYVSEFIEIIKNRKDININENIHFLNASFQDITKFKKLLPNKNKFNKIIISGGVFMYINDNELKECLNGILDIIDEKCTMYISEPIAIDERLTLNKFYSDSLESEYSAIYRTFEQYNKIFDDIYKRGFKLSLSEEFFYDDIKLQKETKQWIFILEK